LWKTLVQLERHQDKENIMSITTITTKIMGYDPTTQHITIAVKTNLCQRNIVDYSPVNIDLANASVPYSIDAAIKDAIATSYYTILIRHVKESKTPEFFQELAQEVNNRMQEDETFIVGVDIPAPPDTDLANETSIPTTLNTDVQVV
jgi:hypothetical protein